MTPEWVPIAALGIALASVVLSLFSLLNGRSVRRQSDRLLLSGKHGEAEILVIRGLTALSRLQSILEDSLRRATQPEHQARLAAIVAGVKGLVPDLVVLQQGLRSVGETLAEVPYTTKVPPNLVLKFEWVFNEVRRVSERVAATEAEAEIVIRMLVERGFLT